MKAVLWNDNWTVYSDIDSTKRNVRLPHDAMQMEKRVPGLPNGSSSGCFPGGKYTYEKTFDVATEDIGKRTFLEFEGIYMKSSVYLNGELLGGHIYGYTDFYVDLTGKVRAGANELKVIADNSQTCNSRWYSGSGIYRDVYLHTSDDEYIKPDGIRVTTKSIAPAEISVTVDAVKKADTSVAVKVWKDGVCVAKGEGADLLLAIPDAKLWSAETPELYELEVALVSGGQELDSTVETFGIRSLAWDSKNGFQVNGKTVKLRGGCVHHDHGVIGAPEFDAACERRVRLMKESGYNAIRISHHPASKAMMRACDKLGMYMMNESFDTWFGLKSPHDYAMYFEEMWADDLSQMVITSYNHPCVVLYSIGNEIYVKEIERTAEYTEKMVKLCHDLDGTRPVINALNPLTTIMGNSENPEQHRDDVVDPRAPGKGGGLAGSQLANTLITLMPKLMKLVGNEKAMAKRNGALAPLDIVGFNYANYLYKKQHEDYPERVLCGTETFPAKIAENWKMVMAMPWVIGDFMWTSCEYLGEAGVGWANYGKQLSFTQDFPGLLAGIGSIDLIGGIGCQGYFSKTVFGQMDHPYIAVHPVNHAGEKCFIGQWRLTDAIHSWSFRGFAGKTTKVDVYSDQHSVELFQDGTSLGKKAVEGCKATFDVTFRAGELRAVAYDLAGRERGTDVLRTAGEDVKLTVTPDKKEYKAGGRDLIYLPISLTDDQGVVHLFEDRKVRVAVDGAAELLGFGTAQVASDDLTPFRHNEVETFEGRALAVLRTTEKTGDVTVTVSAEGLEPVALTVLCV